MWDEEQEGFRHYRSTTNALLNLTQSIVDGFNEEKLVIDGVTSNTVPVTSGVFEGCFLLSDGEYCTFIWVESHKPIGFPPCSCIKVRL
jgi:hypothetical protein